MAFARAETGWVVTTFRKMEQGAFREGALEFRLNRMCGSAVRLGAYRLDTLRGGIYKNQRTHG